jgi:cytochrome c oxidase cbb3-type subunit 3
VLHWKSLPRARILLGVACAALVAGAVIYERVNTALLEARLVRTLPADVPTDPALKHFAAAVAPPVYRKHCASCHGSQLEGNRAQGVPNLADGVWLYGSGSVTDIETTILYGIRSGHPKAHNLTDMPALGRVGQLTKQDIRDVVEYVLLMSRQPHDATLAKRGRAIYEGAGVCYDCHASDAEGVSDYGTPALTGRGGSWLYGGDRETLYKTIYDGRHGLCPAWIGKLSFVEIRALAVYLHETSHHE